MTHPVFLISQAASNGSVYFYNLRSDLVLEDAADKMGLQPDQVEFNKFGEVVRKFSKRGGGAHSI